MEPFINVFHAIDIDQKEYITIGEVQEYVRQNGLDESMVMRWQALFDPGQTGRITFDKFCHVLGLKPEEARAMQRQGIVGCPQYLDPDIEVIFENMPLSDQIRMSREYKRLVHMHPVDDPRQITALMKCWLDATYGRTWHAAVIRGSFWITFSHSEHSSFHFRYCDDCVLIWRTGADRSAGIMR